MHHQLTEKIIGAYYNVYNGLSRTYPKFIYENAMVQELQRSRIESSLVSDTLIPYLERHFADLRERTRSDSNADEDFEFVMPSPVAEKLDGLAHIAGYSGVTLAILWQPVNFGR